MSELIKGKNLGGFSLLPPASDVCQQCAVKHEPWQAHNQQSMFWQYWFYNENGRWPTWADAIAHCGPEVKARWIEELAKHGITV